MVSQVVDKIEEKIIALILGLMTAVTFANVIARYVFNSNILWALELTVFLFAWLVLLGASYAVKKSAHLGVDVLINMLPQKQRRILGLATVSVCIAFTLLMVKGSWDYWANFANLPATEGRWFPLGFEEKFRPKGWYEVNDIPLPSILHWMQDAFNDGDEYEMIPRLLPYMVLPFAMALMVFRFVQAAIWIWQGKSDRLIASHEVEEELEELTVSRQKEGQA